MGGEVEILEPGGGEEEFSRFIGGLCVVSSRSLSGSVFRVIVISPMLS